MRQGGPLLRSTQVYPKKFGQTIARLHKAEMAEISVYCLQYIIYVKYIYIERTSFLGQKLLPETCGFKSS